MKTLFRGTTRTVPRRAPLKGVRYHKESTFRIAEPAIATHDPSQPAARERGARMEIDISCPLCGHDHGVQSVPAAHAEGVSTSYGTNFTTGVGVTSAGLVPVLGTTTVERTHETVLARSLSLSPAQRPVGRLLAIGLLLLIPDLLALVPVTLAIQQPDQVGLLAKLFEIGRAHV